LRLHLLSRELLFGKASFRTHSLATHAEKPVQVRAGQHTLPIGKALATPNKAEKAKAAANDRQAARSNPV
jgi:hypothetical protein